VNKHSLLWPRFIAEWMLVRGILRHVGRGDLEQGWRRARRLTGLARRLPFVDWQWVRQNLRLVFGPALDDRSVERLTALVFEHHVASYVEGHRCGDVALRFEGLQGLHDAMGNGSGAIVTGVHLGSWEMVVKGLADEGIPMATVYLAAENPLLNREFQAARARYGAEWIETTNGRVIARAIRAGKALGLMTDMDSPRGGFACDVLGVPAMCPPGPARLAARFQCPVVPVVAPRDAIGRVTVLCDTPLDPPPREASTKTLAAFTERLNTVFEPLILRFPDQYNWFHARWETRPDGRRWKVGEPVADLWRERTRPFPELPSRIQRLIAV